MWLLPVGLVSGVHESMSEAEILSQSMQGGAVDFGPAAQTSMGSWKSQT